MNDTMRTAADFLMSHDNYDILTHDYPDGDTLGSGYALCRVLRQLGKNARVITTRLPKDFVFLAQGLEEQSFDTQTVVSVDVADEKLLGSNREKYLGKIDLCIDHHEINRVDAPLKCVDPHASSNCEILFELFAEMGVPIDADTAACIYTGVATDTGCFKYSNTTSKTLRIAAELLDLGADAPAINKVMFDTKTKKKLLIEREAYNSLTYCAADRCAIIAVTQDMMKKAGVNDDELEGLASIPRQIEGVEIGITVREKEPNVFKISVRANERLVNAAQFCARFGGGGHAAAAGCRIKGTLAEVTAKLRETAEELL